MFLSYCNYDVDASLFSHIVYMVVVHPRLGFNLQAVNLYLAAFAAFTTWKCQKRTSSSSPIKVAKQYISPDMTSTIVIPPKPTCGTRTARWWMSITGTTVVMRMLVGGCTSAIKMLCPIFGSVRRRGKKSDIHDTPWNEDFLHPKNDGCFQ